MPEQPEDLKRILSAYPLSAGVSSIAPVNDGLINHTWKITLADNNAYILQAINTNIFKDPFCIAGNLKEIRNYLAIHSPHYLFAAPLQTKLHNEMAEDDAQHFFRLFPFVPGSHAVNVVTSSKQAFEAAQQFGRFTKQLRDFDITKLQPALPGFHDLSLRYRQFQSALQQGNSNRIKQAAELISLLQEQKNIVDVFISIPNNTAFKQRVTHHDTKISNVLFNNNDEGLCVIDLDTVMAGYFISDVGDMMRTYLSPVNEEEKDHSKMIIREEYFKAIVQGYFSEMKDELTETEKEYFVYAGKYMVYMQAIRFITDHLNNDSYYGAKYEGHNLIRAGNQACLLQRIIEKEKALNEIVAAVA
jgi:Ser/Thr protein kinase RdoA (MazF antagonist)